VDCTLDTSLWTFASESGEVTELHVPQGNAFVMTTLLSRVTVVPGAPEESVYCWAMLIQPLPVELMKKPFITCSNIASEALIVDVSVESKL
jgi:hypothetical protein